MAKKILYILSGNLSHTPRALKSIKINSEQNYCDIIAINRGEPWGKMDSHLLENLSIKYTTISLKRQKDLKNWLNSKILELISKFLYIINIRSIKSIGFASNRSSILLVTAFYKIKGKYDLIIGHSSGAILPSWVLAKKLQIPYIIDVEDYYPGEQDKIISLNEKSRREFLLKKLLPDALFVTVASPLIGERIKNLVGNQNLKNIAVINNCFPSSEFEFIPQIESSSPLSTSFHVLSRPSTSFFPSHLVHFVWFSQNIAVNRGLELIVPELIKIKNKIHLHLIGNLYNDFNKQWIVPNSEFISTYSPMSQKELNRFICQFDIGLALELSSIDENRNICLTNKIWAYLQSGLFILATNTPAQVEFMNEHERNGIVFDASTQSQSGTEKINLVSLDEALNYIVNNIDTINKEKKNRFKRAKEFSWEKESHKLKNILIEINN